MGSIHTIINRQLLHWEAQQRALEEESIPSTTISPIITISRQHGSRGSYFAERLAQHLSYQLLHRELIDAICESSGYRRRVIESLNESFRGDLDLMVESLFTGTSVDHADYIRHLFQIILSMSKLGGVIIVGRGSNFILGPTRGFHIRFIAPLKQRINNLVKYSLIPEADAARQIHQSDKNRSEFIKKLFDESIENPHKYDLIINTEYLDVEELLEVVSKAMTAKFDKLQHNPQNQ